MKIFWLTPGQLAGALFVGLSIVFAIMYITVPHPVEVPIQIITPVPTPPPVVITERPANINLPDHTPVDPFANQVDVILMADMVTQLVRTSVILFTITIVFGIVTSMMGGGRSRRDQY